MKYYKLKENPDNVWSNFKVGEIYPDNYISNGETLEYWLRGDNLTKHLMQEVREIDYLLQEAKKNYKVGDVVVNMNFLPHKFAHSIISDPYISNNENSIIVDINPYTAIPLYNLYDNKGWAEIIKNEENMKEFPKNNFAVKVEYNAREIIIYLISKGFSNERNLIGDAGNDSYYSVKNGVIGMIFTPLPEGCEIFTLEELKKLDNKMEEKEIIGYKLINPEYEEAAKKIVDSNISWKDDKVNFTKNGVWYNKFKILGLLDIWFEPVYKEEEFKVGDWVTILDKGDHGFKEGYSSYHRGFPTFKIGYVDYKNKFACETDKDIGNGVYFPRLRKATEEEIKNAQLPNITIRGYKAEFFDDYVKFGCQEYKKDFIIQLSNMLKNNSSIAMDYKREIKRLADYYKNK